jgi:hypothetical protein
MSRPLRLERSGGWYHVTARGNERRAIYRDNRDREHFCGLLAGAAEMFGWQLHAYVLMDNHFHLLVELGDPNLGRKGWGIGLKDLGQASGGTAYKSVSAGARRLEQRAAKDPVLAAALNPCRRELQM